MSQKVIIAIVFVFVLLSCAQQERFCECDLMDKKEEYFIKSAELIEANTNMTKLRKGKNLEISSDLSIDLNSIIKERKGQGNFDFKIPLKEKEQYYYSYSVEIGDNENHLNLLKYFLAYCSYYPLYHDVSNNCNPKEEWNNILDKLFNLYLKPKTAKKSKKKGITTKKEPMVMDEKVNTILNDNSQATIIYDVEKSQIIINQ